MKHFFLTALLSLALCAITQAQPATVALWPTGKMPGRGADAPETIKPATDEWHRITNVSTPTLTPFLALPTDTPAPALIVCPGGGYSHVVMDKEGSEIAAWLNTLGMSAFVLKYRVPDNRAGAFQDVQRALSLVRTRAREWNVAPHKIGVIGFSAGGHLAAKASTLFEQRSYAPIDAVDEQSARPDFAVLVYPAYLDKNGALAPELNLKADIPPTLIVHNEDDAKYVAGSKLYAAALTTAQIPHEFKLYSSGGHGYGLHCTKEAKVWPQDAAAWLRNIGVCQTTSETQP